MSREIHELPLESRVDYCSQIFIRHDGIKLADRVLAAAVDNRKGRREGYVGYIKGMSRCGKTETVKRFLKARTGCEVTNPLQVVEGGGARALFVEVKTGATVLGLAQAILHHLSDLRVFNVDGSLRMRRLREQEAAVFLIDTLARNDIGLLVLDEVQNLFRHGGSAAMASAASFLITIQNARGASVVATGTPLLIDQMFATENAVAERKDGLADLSPFAVASKADKALNTAFVAEFERHLPFIGKPGLASDEEMLMRTHYAWRGRPGVLSKLCRAAIRAAFERHKGSPAGPANLTIGDMAAGFDFSLLHDPRMNGINPFSTKKLPPTALSFDGADKTPRLPGKGRGRVLLEA